MVGGSPNSPRAKLHARCAHLRESIGASEAGHRDVRSNLPERAVLRIQRKGLSFLSEKELKKWCRSLVSAGNQEGTEYEKETPARRPGAAGLRDGACPGRLRWGFLGVFAAGATTT